MIILTVSVSSKHLQVSEVSPTTLISLSKCSLENEITFPLKIVQMTLIPKFNYEELWILTNNMHHQLLLFQIFVG